MTRHDTVSLTGAALEDALAPLRRAKSMPAELYTSPEVFGLERERIFLRNWFFLCREEQIPEKGDYKTFDTLGGPIILVRGQDGQLRCFANYCRHRGSLLLQGSGNCGSRIMCPYHAWSYFSDGRLYGCPDMKDAEGFDRTENGLVPVRMESWAGFVFACFRDDSPPLIEHLGDLPQRFGSHRLDQMRCVWTLSIPVACNWKLILENAMETYHTGTVHRDTVGAQVQRPIPTTGDWLCMQVLSRRSIGTMNATIPPLPQIERLDEDALEGTYFSVIHPNVQFAVSQDCMWWLNVIPLSADRSILELGGCFPESSLALPDFDHHRKAYEERWERVAREDMGVLENQQKALTSVKFRPGPLSGRDDMVQAVGRWNLAQLGV
ncbi:aromatic ring-hydroxylating dioxygenase subunit alpha [Tabrizicola sp. J26]|uniref:aromatic ring-hydroxylating oxygenase subunit alpha n=1 Tax=Alitabrizicola rongguiensis TaxID=2909234 RepID=UPI001F175462|nr:aromatic ring-hydroxylating dioxygenase subunit alpha [Tabrizicola rongguiensis]MCF1707712.1 aromatic ring-hydroxylating dioxygenase subunit alpha [Tabrizicola rongguiensis]